MFPPPYLHLMDNKYTPTMITLTVATYLIIGAVVAMALVSFIKIAKFRKAHKDQATDALVSMFRYVFTYLWSSIAQLILAGLGAALRRSRMARMIVYGIFIAVISGLQYVNYFEVLRIPFLQAADEEKKYYKMPTFWMQPNSPKYTKVFYMLVGAFFAVFIVLEIVAMAGRNRGFMMAMQFYTFAVALIAVVFQTLQLIQLRKTQRHRAQVPLQLLIATWMRLLFILLTAIHNATRKRCPWGDRNCYRVGAIKMLAPNIWKSVFDLGCVVAVGLMADQQMKAGAEGTALLGAYT